MFFQGAAKLLLPFYCVTCPMLLRSFRVLALAPLSFPDFFKNVSHYNAGPREFSIILDQPVFVHYGQLTTGNQD